MVYVTHVRLGIGESRHEHITDVKWRNPADANTGQSTVKAMVDFIEGKGVAKVTDGDRTVDVGVVDADPKYIRTYADRVWTDNLLALPRF